MTYRGHIENGAVVLDEPARLPEGAEVEIAVRDPQPIEQGEELLPTLYERLRSVIGIIDGPADLAANHDHYAHGQPKR